MSARRALTDEQVAHVRSSLAAYRAAPKLPGPAALSRQYGVPMSTIWNIERGMTYKQHKQASVVSGLHTSHGDELTTTAGSRKGVQPLDRCETPPCVAGAPQLGARHEQ